MSKVVGINSISREQPFLKFVDKNHIQLIDIAPIADYKYPTSITSVVRTDKPVRKYPVRLIQALAQLSHQSVEETIQYLYRYESDYKNKD